MSKCNKKRIGEKNKVVTVLQPTSFNQYGLRSKAKISADSPAESIVNAENDSSSE